MDSASNDMTAVCERIKDKLSAGRDGYNTRDASSDLLAFLEIRNDLDENGRIVMREGCRVHLALDERKKTRKVRDIRQMSFEQVEGWLQTRIAISEDGDRVVRGSMAYDDIKAALKLRWRKIDEMSVDAGLMQDIIDRHPDWAENPHWTLREVLAMEMADADA